MLAQGSPRKCASHLTISLYMTSLKKHLPDNRGEIIGREHINTAFTTSCPQDGSIVIFRAEEWFKVLIHELFHALGLDFSHLHDSLKSCNAQILYLFPVKSDVNLYESYCELWALILNASFLSYKQTRSKKDFIEHAERMIDEERSFNPR